MNFASRWCSILSLLALIVAVISGCQQPSSLEVDEPVKLRVVATTTIIADVVKAVAGDQISLSLLMGIGVDPHTYVPAPSDVAAVHDADIVFVNGAGLEEFLEDLIHGAGGEAQIFYLTEGLALRKLGEHSHDHEENDHHGHHHGEYDPHVWFSVPKVIRWTEMIAQTLSEKDPTNADEYQANAERYIAALEELDGWIFEQIATIPMENRKLVTNHPAFGYLCQRYGLEQVGAVYPISPSAEPSARDMAHLQDLIHHHRLPAIFTESTVNPKLAEQVARDTGATIVTLYTGSLGEPGSGADTYIHMMRFNVAAVIEALAR